MNHLTKSLLVSAVTALVLLASPVAFAEEPTFLEQLSVETSALAQHARRATVRVAAGGVNTEAILVGSPPRLVTAYVPIGAHQEVQVFLADGRTSKAKRIAGERELDIAVYELPEDVTDRVEALATESNWALPPGRVAVLGGTQPRLLLTRDTRGPRDGLHIGDDDPAGVLIGADGRLLAFRPSVTRVPGYYTVAGTSVWDYTTTVYKRYRTAADVLTLKAGIVPVEPSKRENGKKDEGESVTGQIVDEEGKVVELLVTPHVAQQSYPAIARLNFQRAGPTAVSVLTPRTFLPGALIHRVLEDLSAHGAVQHAYLGIVPASPEAGRGARLVTVLPDSPAAKAGLGEGDVVTAIDGEPVANVAAFTRQIVLRRPGEAVTLLVKGRRAPLRVLLGTQAEARRALPTPADLGFDVVPLTPELRGWLEVKEPEAGVVVRSVTPEGRAAKAGLRRGDVITKGAGQPTRDVEELLAVLAGAEKRLVLTVRRTGSPAALLLGLSLPGPWAAAGAGPR